VALKRVVQKGLVDATPQPSTNDLHHRLVFDLP